MVKNPQNSTKPTLKTTAKAKVVALSITMPAPKRQSKTSAGLKSKIASKNQATNWCLLIVAGMATSASYFL